VKDCYWYVDERIPEAERKMMAMCAKCHKSHGFGWFWEGSALGYGDYDLKCSICETTIHQREKYEN